MTPDDTKLYRQTESDQEANELQEDLQCIMKWLEEWQMLFNTGKCKVMHVGFNNPKRRYTMGDNTLGYFVGLRVDVCNERPYLFRVLLVFAYLVGFLVKFEISCGLHPRTFKKPRCQDAQMSISASWPLRSWHLGFLDAPLTQLDTQKPTVIRKRTCSNVYLAF